LYHARRLAEKLQPAAKLVELHGGHLVSHERTAEVNASFFYGFNICFFNLDLIFVDFNVQYYATIVAFQLTNYLAG
jgi:hypothetical protein